METIASIKPLSGTVKRLVVLLHGYGDSGQGLIDIGHQWQADLPDTLFLSPNAPEVCEGWPQGYQWFSLRAVDGATIERERVIEKPAAILNAFLDRALKENNLDETSLAVAGFSQGAMMAMYTMPRRKKACAGVIGYSGMLVDAEGLRQSDVVKPPILAIHGAMDDVVPPHHLQGVQQGFEGAGFNVETILRPHLSHSIDDFGLQRGAAFIREGFGIE